MHAQGDVDAGDGPHQLLVRRANMKRVHACAKNDLNLAVEAGFFSRKENMQILGDPILTSISHAVV